MFAHLFVPELSQNRDSMTMMEHQRKYEKPLAKYVKIVLVTTHFFLAFNQRHD